MRHLSMLLAAPILCSLPNMLLFLLYFTVCLNCSLYFFYLFSLFFSFVLLRAQKCGMDLLHTSGFFRQRAHTRNFCGSHPRVTLLATHKLLLFSSKYDDSSAISCCPYLTSCTTPPENPTRHECF